MSGSGAAAEPGTGYIRGGGALASVSRHTMRILVGALLVALAALTVAYSVDAHHQNSRRNQLRSHGVPVKVTVTGCVGTATGTGITVNAFTCRGSFLLGGETYNDVIGGSKRLFSQGQVIPGVADPHSPSVMSSAAAVANEKSSNDAYSAAVVCGGGFLLVIIFALWWSRRDAIGPDSAEPAAAEPEAAKPVALTRPAAPVDAAHRRRSYAVPAGVLLLAAGAVAAVSRRRRSG